MSNRNLPRAPSRARLDFRRMSVGRVFAKLTLTQLLGNLIGGLLTWFYFRFVDFTAPQFQARISRSEIVFFVVAFGILISAGIIFGSHWSRPCWCGGFASAAPAASLVAAGRARAAPRAPVSRPSGCA